MYLGTKVGLRFVVKEKLYSQVLLTFTCSEKTHIHSNMKFDEKVSRLVR